MADEQPSSSPSTKIHHTHYPFPDSSHDILVAAQKLMQLSDENNNGGDGDGDVTGKRKRDSFSDEQEVDQRPPNNDKTSAKIKEIFGNDVEVIPRPKKMKRYRSLAFIYKVTRPIHAGKGKRLYRLESSDLEFDENCNHENFLTSMEK